MNGSRLPYRIPMRAEKPPSAEVGTVGEHLATSFLLSALGRRLPQSRIEVFEVDRGADLGIDSIVRISSKTRKHCCLQIAVQVKATQSNFVELNPDLAHRNLIGSFPGAALLLGLKFNYEEHGVIPEVIYLGDYACALSKGRKSKGKIKINLRNPVSPNKRLLTSRTSRRRIIDEIWKFVRSLCEDFLLKEDRPEVLLDKHGPKEARKYVRILEWLACPRDKTAKLLENRIALRKARLTGGYRDLICRLERGLPKPTSPRKKCPDYRGYCAHYQAALALDESTRFRSWTRGVLDKNRKNWRRALGIINAAKKFYHNADAKKKLYRLGLYILAARIASDVIDGSHNRSERRNAWRSEFKKLRSWLSTGDSLLGCICEDFVRRSLRSRSRIDPKKFLGTNLGRLRQRARTREQPEDHALCYLFGSVLWLMAGENGISRARELAELARAIDETCSVRLELTPIEFAIKEIRRRERRTISRK